MLLFAAIFGFVIGVAVNALADSLPRHRRIKSPFCSNCGRPRSLLAWSGTVAFLTGRRACPYCGSPLSLRHPVVEISAALWVTWLQWSNPDPAVFWPALLLSTIFLLILVTDFEHRLILHAVTVPGAFLMGVIGILDPSRGPVKTLLGGVVGFVGVFVLYLLGGVFARSVQRMRGQQLEEVAFGFGDVTLAGVIGLAVGWPGILVAIFIGIMTGGFFSLFFLLFMIIRRKYEAFVPIPYSPFLILGALVVYIGGRSTLVALLPS
jgi:prepilin signal peptidase PulO-like enzyme (type II secretory pathway)